MEFKFRAVDDRPISYVSPSSGSGQPSTVGPAVFPSVDFPSNEDPMRNPNELQDLILRERIREEIIAVEIAKRRVLEAEVRRELAYLEREMAMLRGAPERSSLEDQWAAMRFEPRLPLVHAFAQRSPLPTRSGACGVSPGHSDTFARDSTSASLDKFIVLAKPNLNLSGAKRKAVEPPIVNAGPVHSFGLKKPREEWSCALCQFSAISERELNEHLEGEKHKTSEKELQAQRKCKNSNSPLAKKTGKLSKPMETHGTACLVLDANVKKELLKHNETLNDSDKERENTNVVEFKFGERLVQKTESTGNMDKINGAEIVQTLEKTAEFKNKNKFKFWCDLCQVGAYHVVVMDDHKKGKRHRGLLRLSGSNGKKENANEELLFQKYENTGKLNEINGAEMVQGVGKTTELENKESSDHQFWCESCQLGFNHVNPAIAIEEHNKGKKHRENLLQLKVTWNGSEGKKENAKDQFKSEELLAKKSTEINEAEIKQGVEKTTGPKNMKSSYFKFWCDKCQLGTNLEKRMDEHLNGKRHRRSKGTVWRKENAKDGGSKSEELLMPKFGNAGKCNEKNVVKIVVQGADKKEHENKNLKFWCELCQVGADSEIVMEDHKKGKRHFLKVEELKEKNCASRNQPPI
ncbi:hypothetical protein FNV43_RR03375 [Rhamnella rubrinervis]|uniref:Uncharacterized protein n=1 Tax=Rhamnella rubrinervis TaxID=2594499 RepID=A0A8K0HHN0_9ROSA|nr:hypothetical protein FNV43_RR03375 [Rhamnella rubrinervis]